MPRDIYWYLQSDTGDLKKPRRLLFHLRGRDIEAMANQYRTERTAPYVLGGPIWNDPIIIPRFTA
jgi:hypothetical protein